MITNHRSVSIMKAVRISDSRHDRSAVSDWAVRAIQVALALYLIPVLLVVLAVGGLGMLALGVNRCFTGPVRGSLG